MLTMNAPTTSTNKHTLITHNLQTLVFVVPVGCDMQSNATGSDSEAPRGCCQGGTGDGETLQDNAATRETTTTTLVQHPQLQGVQQYQLGVLCRSTINADSPLQYVNLASKNGQSSVNFCTFS